MTKNSNPDLVPDITAGQNRFAGVSSSTIRLHSKFAGRSRLSWALLWCLISLWVPTLSFADEAKAVRNTNLRSDPSSTKPPIELISASQTVTLLGPGKTHGYYHVRAQDGKEGWALARNLHKIPTGGGGGGVGGSGGSSATDAFQPGCALPFNAAAVHHDVDTQCGNVGTTASSKPAGQEQNRRKNDLCQDASSPVAIDVTTLKTLQTAVDAKGTFHYGDDAALNSNSSRAALAALKTTDAGGNAVTLGEGRVVVIDAFVLHAKHDDVPLLNPKYHGESVNCGNDDVEFNDIHIALGAKSSDKECDGVTAEITPHFRPASWDRFDNDPKTSPAVNGLAVKGLEIKITGPLFFDASHKPNPCGANLTGQPPRLSLWEIHPVYKIEVVDGGHTISFDDWAKTH